MPSQRGRDLRARLHPSVRGVHARVAENFGALLHALLKLDGKAEQRGVGKFETLRGRDG